MGAFTRLDPSTVKPMPGKCIVKIVEILGGQTKGGLWKPASYAGHMGKDTMYAEFVRIGDPPSTKHAPKKDGSSWANTPNKSGAVWAPEVMAQFQLGDIGVFPRDVELVFVWGEERFGICHLHEALFVIPKESFDPMEIEVVPWQAPPLPG